MTKEEAISELEYAQAMCKFNPSTGEVGFRNDEDRRQYEAFGMAIEALQFAEHFDLLKEFQSLQEVVRCKDCRHASECHQSIQYTHNEPNTVNIRWLSVEWCSRGERKEP